MRAAGPGPVARLDHPLVDEDPVRGRRPDVAPGPQQDVGDQPGDRALAVRPGDRDDRDRAGPRRGSRPAASPAPSAIRSDQRASSRSWAPVRWARPRRRDVALGEGERRLGQRSGRAPRPTHGNVTIQWPGSDERWTATPPRPSPWSGTQAPDPADRRAATRIGPVAGRDRRRRGGPARGGPGRAARTRSAAGRRRPRA